MYDDWEQVREAYDRSRFAAGTGVPNVCGNEGPDMRRVLPRDGADDTKLGPVWCAKGAVLRGGNPNPGAIVRAMALLL